MAAIISVKNLIKRYKKTKINAVDGISFDVAEGDFFAFLGPNGAGKTTTISILTTTLSKTEGEVIVAGHDVSKEANMVRQNIGIIFQNPSLDMNLTAEENIRFHALLYNLYPFSPLYSLMPKKYKDQVNELAEVIGIHKELHKPVKTFSGGMKRKLEIIRSLMHNPKVLFLDEPTTGLDPVSRKNLWQYLMQVREREHTTIFLTTHYLEEAEEADEVAIINGGKIVAEGAPDQIKKDLVEEYLLLDADKRDQLLAELNKQNVQTTEVKNGIKVRLNGHSAQDIIKGIDTKLTTLRVHTPTLEEAYLEIINRPTNNEKTA